MNILVAQQSHFNEIKKLNENVNESIMAIVRCRCRPNKCTTTCTGCVGCLGRKDNNAELNDMQLLEDFFAD